MNKNLFKKFLEFGIGSILTLAIGFISSPIITRLITPEENGKFSMINTFMNLALLIILIGLDQSYVRFFYDEDEKNRPKLLKKCIKVPILLGVIISIVIMFLYKPISTYLVEEQSFFVTILLVINLICSVISRFSMLQIRMSQKAKTYSFINVLLKILNLVFVIVIFLIYKNSYITLMIAMTLANIIVLVVSILVEKNVWFSNTKSTIKTSNSEMIKYGAPLIFSMAIIWIFQSIDKISIKQFAGYEQLGFYNGAMTIIVLLNAVQSTFTTFWTPVAFEKYSKKPEDKEFFSKINKLLVVSMLFIAIMLIASKDLIILLLGEKYRQAVFIFPFLVFMPIMYTISETTVLGINFKKKQKCHIYIAIISAITNLIGNLILVPKLGARGAAISTGIAYVIFFLARTYFSNKYYKVNYSVGKFMAATMCVYILAIYSSFYKFNMTIIILTIANLIMLLILYRNVFIDGIKYLKHRKEVV